MASRLDRMTDWEELARGVNYDAKELAVRCNVSLRQLERHFHEVFNESPHTWIRGIRMRDAQELIAGRPFHIKEVAYRLGYKQVSHFCREFKRHYGVSPGNFAQCERT